MKCLQIKLELLRGGWGLPLGFVQFFDVYRGKKHSFYLIEIDGKGGERDLINMIKMINKRLIHR